MIETVNLKEHDFATSSNPAFVISNKDTMVATYYVSEDVRNTFSVGQKITLKKDDAIYDGEVIEIGSAIDATTGLFKVKAAVKGTLQICFPVQRLLSRQIHIMKKMWSSYRMIRSIMMEQRLMYIRLWTERQSGQK